MILQALSLLNPSGWLGYRAKLSGGNQPPSASDVGGGGNYANKPVTLDTALQLATFWACTRLTAETIGTLPINLLANGAKGFNAVATDHPVHALIHDRPNLEQTPVEFWEGIAAWMLTWGSAYAEKFVTAGEVRSLTLLRSDLMSPYWTTDGQLRFRYSGRGQTHDYARDELFVVRGFGFGDILGGMSVIQYGRQTMSTAGAAEEASGSTFANGMRPSGWFKYKGGNGIMSDEQRRLAKKALVDPYTGAGNTARVGILEGDFDWISASLPPGDSELLDTRRFNVEEICRWFGMPPILVGHAGQGQTMWGTGVDKIMLAWLTLGLRNILRRIQQCVARDLLSPGDRGKFFAEFNQDALLQADTETRTRIMAQRVQNGLSNRNEERAIDNLPPFDGGEKYTVQSNLLPVDKLGEVAVQPTEKPVGDEQNPPSKDGGGQKGQIPFEGKSFDESKHPRAADGKFSAGSELLDLVKVALDDGAHEGRVFFGSVDSAEISEAAGQDVGGWRFSADAQYVRHIKRKHGPGSGDRNPIVADDYAHIPEIVASGKATAGGKTRSQGLQVVIIKKTVDNVNYRAVFSVRKAMKTLALHTFSKTRQ